jgi:cytochrome c-type biogenesis protein
MELPFALAFTAGLVATINPCGFAMLPAYLSYFLGLDEGAGDPAAGSIGRGLVVGAVVSAGFLTVFGLAGVLLSAGVQVVIDVLPWAAMVVGIGVAVLGVALLRGHELRVSLPEVGRAPQGRGLRGVYLFGVSYAVASLSCTLPVFLIVVAGTIPQLGFVAGVATFLVYGLGMSTLLLLVTLAVATGKRAFVGRLRRSSQHVNRIAGGVLVLAGAYIVVFWVSTLVGDGTSQLAAVTAVEQLSSRVTNEVSRWSAALGFAGAAGATGVLVAWLRSRRRAASGATLEQADEITSGRRRPGVARAGGEQPAVARRLSSNDGASDDRSRA